MSKNKVLIPMYGKNKARKKGFLEAPAYIKDGERLLLEDVLFVFKDYIVECMSPRITKKSEGKAWLKMHERLYKIGLGKNIAWRTNTKQKPINWENK